MESSGGNEQDVIGAHHAVATADRGAFDDGQDVALHALAGDVWPVAALASGYLIDFVQEDDARLFYALDRRARDLVHIDEALLFFLNQIFKSLADLHLPLLGALAEDVGQHVLDVDVHLLDALVGDDFKGGHRAFSDVEFYGALVQLAFPQLLAELLSRARLAGAGMFSVTAAEG